MVEQLPRVLGDELRQARTHHGWTRGDLLARLRWEVSLPTLATYELGTRPLTVVRFVELSDALSVSPLDVLSRTLARAGKAEQVNRLEIDLLAIASDRTAELTPLRRWAQARMCHMRHGEPTSAWLDQATLPSLAEICGLTTYELIGRLCSLTAS